MLKFDAYLHHNKAVVSICLRWRTYVSRSAYIDWRKFCWCL